LLTKSKKCTICLSAKPENLELIGPADDRGYSEFNRCRG